MESTFNVFDCIYVQYNVLSLLWRHDAARGRYILAKSRGDMRDNSVGCDLRSPVFLAKFIRFYINLLNICVCRSPSMCRLHYTYTDTTLALSSEPIF